MSEPVAGKFLPGEEITPQDAESICKQIHDDLKSRTDTDDSAPITELRRKVESFEQKMDSGLTTDHFQEVMNEIQKLKKRLPDDTKQKKLDETKRLIDTFKEKVAAYPKYLSYDGSVVLCVMLSIGETQNINLNGLPTIDREVVLSQLPEQRRKKFEAGDIKVSVRFDENKDFILEFSAEEEPSTELHFFNTIIHPQRLEEKDIPIETEGGKISVGGKLKFEAKRIQRMSGVPEKFDYSSVIADEEDSAPKVKRAANRNAFEIRTDILEMAVDWVNANSSKKSEEEVLRVAKMFYTFVEDRNRR